jgi:hypothetical protein
VGAVVARGEPDEQGGVMAAERSSWGRRQIPTRKWAVATVIGAGALATAWAEAGEWSSTLTVTAVGFVVQRLVAWLVPNNKETE